MYFVMCTYFAIILMCFLMYLEFRDVAEVYLNRFPGAGEGPCGGKLDNSPTLPFFGHNEAHSLPHASQESDTTTPTHHDTSWCGSESRPDTVTRLFHSTCLGSHLARPQSCRGATASLALDRRLP